MREEYLHINDKTLLFNGVVTNPEELAKQFDMASTHAVDRNNSGRGTVYFISREGQQQWVVREYRRGGLIGKFVGSTYFYWGLERTRMAREFRLLAQLYRQGLPVPRPVATQITCRGLICRGLLVTERLLGAKTLCQQLEGSAVPEDQWKEIGRCIRRFHDLDICHADLNANNIMLDDEQVYLIDFDKGRVRHTSRNRWKRANLARLRRSLNKLKASAPAFHFHEHNWQQLLEGYGDASASCSNRTLKSER